MSSSLVAGPLFRALRIGRILTILAGGRLRIEAGAAPSNPVKGDLYVTTAGVLMIHNGTAFVAVGSQV